MIIGASQAAPFWTEFLLGLVRRGQNGEIEPRTDVAGTFPNEASIRRLGGAILMAQTGDWAVRRVRYMTLETLAPVCDALAVSLPAALTG